MGSLLEQLDTCLNSALKVRDAHNASCSEIDLDADRRQRIQWLDGQLAALISQLQGLIVDLESGLSEADLGYASGEDVEDLIELVECEIRQIQRTMKEVKGLSRH
jgi:hypothetical protein